MTIPSHLCGCLPAMPPVPRLCSKTTDASLDGELEEGKLTSCHIPRFQSDMSTGQTCSGFRRKFVVCVQHAMQAVSHTIVFEGDCLGTNRCPTCVTQAEAAHFASAHKMRLYQTIDPFKAAKPQFRHFVLRQQWRET